MHYIVYITRITNNTRVCYLDIPSHTLHHGIIPKTAHSHINFPSEKSHTETLPGKHMGKATLV